MVVEKPKKAMSIHLLILYMFKHMIIIIINYSLFLTILLRWRWRNVINRGNESISESCVSNAFAEIQTAVGKISKTKENKAILSAVQKALKHMDSNSIHM